MVYHHLFQRSLASVDGTDVDEAHVMRLEVCAARALCTSLAALDEVVAPANLASWRLANSIHIERVRSSRFPPWISSTSSRVWEPT